MKKIICALLAILIVSSSGGQQVMAAEIPDKNVEIKNLVVENEILLRAQRVDVPAYYYILKDYDGSVTITATVYKQVNVPAGCKIVSTGPSLVYYEKEAYYQGTRYAEVSKMEWKHTVVQG